MGTLPSYRPAPWRRAWAGVFLANLVVPLLFGWGCTENHGRVGMFLAIVPFWILGNYACGKGLAWSVIFVAGGTIMGLFQVFPAPHVMAGMLALSVTSRLEQMSVPGAGQIGGQIQSEMGGWVATTLTGSILLVEALCLGWIVYRFPFLWITERRAGRLNPKSGVFDPEIDG